MSKNKESPFIIFLTGASGSGKTTLLDALKKKLHGPSVTYLHFDSIGVPSEEEMVKKYGSPSEWQKAMTIFWINKIVNEYSNKKLVIIEGQVNFFFIATAFKDINYNQYKIILIHCDTKVRHHRLYVNRNQPELINENMDSWAKFLKNQASEMNVTILDTSAMTVNNMRDSFIEYITELK